jgi:hypothetical protein
LGSRAEQEKGKSVDRETGQELRGTKEGCSKVIYQQQKSTEEEWDTLEDGLGDAGEPFRGQHASEQACQEGKR